MKAATLKRPPGGRSGQAPSLWQLNPKLQSYRPGNSLDFRPKHNTLTPRRKPVQRLLHRRLSMEPPVKVQRRRQSVGYAACPAVAKFAHSTRTGVIPGHPEKVNQDAFFECINLGPQQDTYLFGVCDGHGQFGHFVSDFVKHRLPVLVSNHPDLVGVPENALRSSILQCNQEISQLNIDTELSGTTLVLVLIRNSTLWCANVGDSRAVLGRKLLGKLQWMALALSRDHKPDLEEEAARIHQAGGRVQSYLDEHGAPAGPARVWLRDEDAPGLAMSRSLGDELAASVGVVAEPEILKFVLTPEDKFLVLGSDGVFEFMSNEEAVKLLIPYWTVRDPQGAVSALQHEAATRWRREEEVIDDITALIVFIDVV